MATMSMELQRLGIDPKDVAEKAKGELNRRQRAIFYLNQPFLFQRDVIIQRPDWRDNLCKMHEEGLEFVAGGKRKKLILWPRKHLKSTIFTQGESIRRALRDPDVRILLSSARWDNAKRFLAAIKGTLRNPQFIALYGNLLPGNNDKYYRNNDAELTITTRENFSLREPTFSTTGLDAAQTSQHYDLIIHDDLVERRNISSIDMMDKVITYYKDSLDLLDSMKELWVIGTRWHPLDLYGWIMAEFCDPRCKENDWNHVSNCRCDFDVTLKEIKEEGNYIFSTMFNDKEAEELLRQKGRYEFASQYLNNPTDPSVCWFRESDIKAAEIDPAIIKSIRERLTWYIAVDPAESAEKRSSFTAAVAFGVDLEGFTLPNGFESKIGTWYVDDAVQARVETAGFIDLCMKIHERYKPSVFGMEMNTRKSLAYSLKDKMGQIGYFFSIKELSPMKAWAGANVKEQRIKRLQPLLEYGRLRINNTLTDLLNCLYTIPAATSWDLPDALSYGMDMVPSGLGNTLSPELPKRIIGWKGCGY